jgi:hypothetical protein
MPFVQFNKSFCNIGYQLVLKKKPLKHKIKNFQFQNVETNLTTVTATRLLKVYSNKREINKICDKILLFLFRHPIAVCGKVHSS